ncbi:MAG: hypothetical protein AB8I08_17300 [Sandaracinaceae bacterium]
MNESMRWVRPSNAAVWGLCVTVLALSGCVRNLPPPEAPGQELSAELMAEVQAPTEEGQGVVVLDAVGDPAEGEDMGEADGANAQTVCEQTPCVVRLEQGEHRLVFHRDGRDDQVELDVGATPIGHRRALSFDSGEHNEYLAMMVIGFGTAAVMSPIFSPIADLDGQFDSGGDIGLVLGGAFAGAMFGVGLIGAILAIANPREVREGRSTVWQLDLE